MIERTQKGFCRVTMIIVRAGLKTLQTAVAGVCLFFVARPILAQAPEPDVRRDATVAAVEKVMPAVVNIATETIVNVQDPFDDLLRRFFDPYHRHRAPNAQLSLGSGVIIDEEGYVLTNDHVVRRADKIWVKVYGTETPYEAKLIANNPKSEIGSMETSRIAH